MNILRKCKSFIIDALLMLMLVFSLSTNIVKDYINWLVTDGGVSESILLVIFVSLLIVTFAGYKELINKR